MKKRTIKSFILCLLAVMLCVTACGTAFASAGDRTVLRFKAVNGTMETWIYAACKVGDDFCVVMQEGGNGTVILRYTDPNGEPERFTMKQEMPEYVENGEFMPGEELAIGDEQAPGEEPAAEEPVKEEPAAEEPAAEAGISELSWDDLMAWDESAEDSQDPMPIGADEGFNWDDADMYEENSTYTNTDTWFGWKGDIYALAVTQNWRANTVDSIKIQRAKLEDGQFTLEDTELPELDHESIMSEMSDGYFSLGEPFTAGNYLIGTVYAGMSNKVCMIDLETGAAEFLDLGEINSITLGPDNSLVYARYDWQSSKCTICRADMKGGNEETLTEFDLANGTISLCYDPDTDMLYYTANGELNRMPQMDPAKAEAVNDCPMNYGRIVPLKDGFVVIWDSSTILRRNTDPAARGGITLRVANYTWDNELMSETSYDMGEKRGDVSVVTRVMDSYRQASTVVQDMMNKDGTTDIYLLSFDGSDFRALRNRGYLADLSDNAQLVENVERMYPYIQDALKQDGKLVCIPVMTTGESFSVNYDLWKRTGGTEEELPKTWDQFFDWLETLPERFAGQDVKICEEEFEYFTSTVMNTLIESYQVWMERKGEDFKFNTPVLNRLLSRLNGLDADRIGIKERSEDDDDYGYVVSYSYYQENNTLLSAWAQLPLNRYNSQGGHPMALSFAEDEDPVLPVHLNVACVNPFSEHAAEAKEFLALALNNLALADQYAFYSDHTEPVHYSYYEENRENMQKWLDELQKNYDEADEGEEKINAEEALKQQKDMMEMEEKYSWVMSPETLERFQKNLPSLKVMSRNIYDDITQSVEEADWAKVAPIGGGEGSLEDALKFIDEKIQMIRMEGN